MNVAKFYFQRAISIGVHSDLSEGKKLAVQIATLDGYWTILVFLFYVLTGFPYGKSNLFAIHVSSLLFSLLGVWFLWKRFYDAGRMVLHFVGLFIVFMTADATGIHSGAELFYFTSVAIPFVTFNFEEQWKGNLLTCIACFVFLFQQYFGGHLFMDPVAVGPHDKLVAIVFVISYFIIVFGVGRRQLKVAHEELKRQQDEIIHSSKLASIGEMAAGIAHEINNPLQSLSLQLLVLNDKTGMKYDEIPKMETTINKIAKMVQGLRHLSRDSSKDSKETFSFSKVLDDVLAVSSDRILENKISLSVTGDPLLNLSGHPVHISQVLLNLLNNSIDAIRMRDEKWVRIDISCKNSFLEVSVTDSGKGINPQVASKMMNAFFTTKKPSEGSGLGLSITKAIVEKNNGRIYYDSSSSNTRFVLLLPLAVETQDAYEGPLK